MLIEQSNTEKTIN